jgi:hypothetical protein
MTVVPKKTTRRLAAKSAAAAVALCLATGAGGAYAYWATVGAGSGAATNGTMKTVSVEALVAGDGTQNALVPGGTADVAVRAFNPNDFAVQVYAIRGNGPRRRGVPPRLHHHRGDVCGPRRPTCARSYYPGELLRAHNLARSGCNVACIIVRLPGCNLQPARHLGGPEMIRPNQAPQPIESGHWNQPRRRKLAQIAGVLAAAVVISWGGPAANAFWQTLGSNAGTARADSIPAVAAPGASVSGGSASITWKQGTTAGGRPVAGYTVARYSAATGGTKVAAGGGCAGTLTALTCNETSLPGGTWYYTVTPVLGAWAGTESARSGGVAGDSTPPVAPTITVPAVVNIANAFSVPVRVTAEAGSSVKITLGITPLGQATQTVSQTLIADGTVQTVYFDLSIYGDGSISYAAVATDAAGNASVAGTANSTKDTLEPTATVTLSNVGKNNTVGTVESGDTVSIKYSKPMDLKSICSTWVTGQQPAEMSTNGDIVVTITGTDLAVSRTGSGCALNIGTVSLGAIYATSGSLTFQGNGNNASKISWNNTTQTLTISLGGRTGNAKPSVAASSPSVAPPTGVTDVNGNQAVGAAPASPSGF